VAEMPHTRHQETSVAFPDCIPFHDEANVKDIFALFQPLLLQEMEQEGRHDEGQADILFSELEFLQTSENKQVNQTIRLPEVAQSLQRPRYGLDGPENEPGQGLSHPQHSQ
jgi:hypothetical protein